MLHIKTACNQLTQHPSSTSCTHQTRALNTNFVQCHKTVITFYPFLSCNSFVVVIVLIGTLLSTQIFMLNTQLPAALLKHSCSIHIPTASSQICKHFWTTVICWDYHSHTCNPELLTLGKSLFLSSLSIFVKINLSLCLFKRQAMKTHRRKKSATYIPNTGIRERWMFNSISWLYPQGNSLWYLLNGTLCGPKPGLWHFGENEKIYCPFAPAGNQIPICLSSSL